MADEWEDKDRRHRHHGADDERRHSSRRYENDERDMRRSYGGYSGSRSGDDRDSSRGERYRPYAGDRDARYGRDDEERYGGNYGDPVDRGARSQMGGQDYGQGSYRQRSGSDSSGFGRYGAEYGSQRRSGQGGNDLSMGNDNQWERRAYGSQHQHGEHRGMGPKGYKRSDDRIREDVCDMLTEAGHLDASGIEVAVKEGEVTLSGSVTSRGDKREAEDMVEHCSGVKNVQNNLKVERKASSMSAMGMGSSTQDSDPGGGTRTPSTQRN